MTTSRSTKGEPLIVLGMLLAIWLAARILLWESPLVPGLTFAERAQPVFEEPTRQVRLAEPTTFSSPVAIFPEERRLLKVRPWKIQKPVAALISQTLPAASDKIPAPPTVARTWEKPIANPPQPPTPALLPQPQAKPSKNRWSLDAWLLVRNGSSQPVGPQTIRPASYGASQAGAVLRYRLAPSSRHDPTLYARATKALTGVGETDFAVGAAAKPLPALPLAAHAEVRATLVQGTVRARPAIFAVTEIPQQSLPLGANAEIYGQAGYVGGAFASAFADGQVRVDRGVAVIRGAELRLGGGAWAGVQKGVSRVDLGPSASLNLRLAEVPIRVSADYRIRVAGNAEPQSGPAITISSGF